MAFSFSTSQDYTRKYFLKRAAKVLALKGNFRFADAMVSANAHNGFMDFGKTIEELNSTWLIRRASLSKEDLAYLSYQDSFRHRLEGFLTQAYYQRKKMIPSSDIFYAYVFQDWSNDGTGLGEEYPTWLLFSPSREVNQDPLLLKKIAANLQSIKEKDVLGKEEKELKKLLVEPLSDCSFFEIPSSLAEGKLIYLSIVYVHLERVSYFHLGLNLILSSPSISQEVLYFPTKYWPKDLLNAYTKGEFTL